MKTLRNWTFALIILMSIIFPAAASADGGNATPDCNTNPDACQTMLAQYEDLYGPLPSPTPTPDSAVVTSNIEMTGGNPLPQNLEAERVRLEGKLNEIALTYCTDPYWVESVQGGVYIAGWTSEYTAQEISTYEKLGWEPAYEEYDSFLQEQAEAEFNVPSRPPTLWELIQKYPGCDTGEYVAPSK